MRLSHVPVALALAATLGLAACGGEESGTVADVSEPDDAASAVADPTADAAGSSDGSVGDDTNTQLPEDFPTEIVPPDGVTYRTAMSGDQGGRRDWFVVGSLDGEVDAVAVDVTAQLEDAGFEILSEEAGGIPGGAQSVTVQAESSAYTVGVTVDNADVVGGGGEGAVNVSYTVTER